MKSQFIRFLAGGGINTAVTYALFLMLSSALHHAVAYSIVYAVGIVLSYVINVGFVFQVKPAVGTAIVYPAIYAVQYFYGLAGLFVLIDHFGISREVAMLVIIGTSIPLTFGLTRVLLRTREIASTR